MRCSLRAVGCRGIDDDDVLDREELVAMGEGGRRRPASALAEPTAAAEQPTRAAAQESPVPSIRAAAPAATPARTGSARRDTQATRAISPPSTTTRAPNLPSSTPRRAADEFANPTGAKISVLAANRGLLIARTEFWHPTRIKRGDRLGGLIHEYGLAA